MHLPKKCEVFDAWLDLALDLANGFHLFRFPGFLVTVL
jgi:hypothetical protein